MSGKRTRADFLKDLDSLRQSSFGWQLDVANRLLADYDAMVAERDGYFCLIRVQALLSRAVDGDAKAFDALINFANGGSLDEIDG